MQTTHLWRITTESWREICWNTEIPAALYGSSIRCWGSLCRQQFWTIWGIPVTLTEARTIDTVSEFYKSMNARESRGKDEQERLYLRILMITDYITGMTCNYAKKLYHELFE